MADYEDQQDKVSQYWQSHAGQKKLAEEREKTFAGEPDTVTMEMIDRIWMKYKRMMEST